MKATLVIAYLSFFNVLFFSFRADVGVSSDPKGVSV
jgi:hypothetical protein